MNILLTHRPGGAYAYISDGWMNALNDMGHTARRWNGDIATWKKFKPDVYIGCSGHRQPIPTDNHCRIAIHVNPYGPSDIKGINESNDTIRWVLRQRPAVVFGYGREEDRILWQYWTTRHGIKWVPMPTAGDKTIYKKVKPQPDRSVDVVYVGGRWSYKAKSIDAFLLPVLANIQNNQVRGWGDWPASVNVSAIEDQDVCAFLNSGKVGPCIAEPHTHSYGIDIPERAFKVALCGTIVIHDCVPAIKDMIPSALVAKSPQDFLDLCVRYCFANTEERESLAEAQRNEVLQNHTYHNRMSTLLEALGFSN